MNKRPGLKRWLALVACCLPGIAAVAVVTLGTVAGLSFDGPLSGLLVLALLACPLTTFLMLSRRLYGVDQSSGSPKLVGCCMSPNDFMAVQSERLSVLHTEQPLSEPEVVGDPC